MRLLVYWIAAGLVGYVLFTVPAVVAMFLLGVPSDARNVASFFIGMLSGGLTPPLGLSLRRVQEWVG